MAEGVVRGAEEGDMPAVRAVAERFGLLRGWSSARDFLDAERAFGRLVLAPTANGQARGFGGTLRRGAVTHLGDLFVLPEHQSSGVGRGLLAELMGGGGPKVTFASSDPRAMSLYIRYGLRPWCPLLYLTGPASALPGPPVREAGPEDVAELDAHAGGGARRGTLAWYAATPGVTLYTTGQGYAFVRVGGGDGVSGGDGVMSDGDVVGRGDIVNGGDVVGGGDVVSGRDVVIGPAGGVTPRDCVEAVLGALAATVRASAAGSTPQVARIAVPGVHPLVTPLVEAGWRIGDLDTFMADDAALSLIRPDCYVPHPDLG
ncbi:GNAT family N-acetyltransferase [Nonomuraea roseoviolacea]|uniref:GNAT superfamily N-acetyltransferase n=1 Tax=Nonomuraea roseoviolacea subsp. carminata TaxID=160689 RepID=A0ABT1JVT9_9ACTN|nr:GNAT family N-acetyltransferase [Nonomuraea roseoviolacea]MCP2345442.1 GNAT superfamily N-acetyltransferase [Nonomuraea roseoviolacea subsp. carminata]